MFDYLDIPKRETKPREMGLTHVVDAGMGIEQARDRLAVCKEHVDIVKFGWGTSYVSEQVAKKIELYQDCDIKVVFGGTLFEVAVLQDRLEEYVSTLRELDVDCVEVSAGTVDIGHAEKCEHIERLSDDFIVLSEVGQKDPDDIIPPNEWINRIRTELDAGSWKVIAEGRESGEAGVYRRDGEVRFGLIDEIIEATEYGDIIFEAPNKDQQTWFIERFDERVNLGNVKIGDVIGVETLRLGLRGDTVEKFHGKRE